MNKHCKNCTSINWCPFAKEWETNFKPTCYKKEFHNTQTNNSTKTRYEKLLEEGKELGMRICDDQIEEIEIFGHKCYAFPDYEGGSVCDNEGNEIIAFGYTNSHDFKALESDIKWYKEFKCTHSKNKN